MLKDNESIKKIIINGKVWEVKGITKNCYIITFSDKIAYLPIKWTVPVVKNIKN